MGQILNRRRVMGGSPKINWADEYLTFEALESGTFQFTNAVEYSLNNGAWTSLAASTATPTLVAGNLIRWRATITPTSSAGVGTFSSTCYYNAMGNPLSLNLGDSFVGVTTMPNKSYMFYKLFYQDTHIKSAKNMMLVCTTLRNTCYMSMFESSSVEVAPLISGTSFPSNSCNSMFLNCENLRTVQPFTIASLSGEANFYSAFKNCTSLQHAPITVTFSGSMPFSSFVSMFYGCSLLIDAMNALPAYDTYKGYGYMFYGCYSLISPPSIDASYITNASYMFAGCTSLVEPPVFTATEIIAVEIRNMFSGCTSIKSVSNFTKKIAQVTIIHYMLEGCKNIEESVFLAPSVNGSEGAFMNCSNLKYIKCLFEGNNLGSWNFSSGVAANGTFVKHPDSTWVSGGRGIPTGWTVLEAVQITVTYTGDNSGAYLKEIGGSEIIHTFIDGEPYEADLDDNKSYGVYDSGDNLIQTLTTPFSRTVSITI